MPAYSYRVRKPAPAPEIVIDRTVAKPSADKAAAVSRPSVKKAVKSSTTRTTRTTTRTSGG